MRKVKYTEPRPIGAKDRGIYDPARYIAQTCDGYLLEIEPENVIIHKDPRGMWTIVDPGTGYRIDSVRTGYKTRKEAMQHATEAARKLHEFKTSEASGEHYRRLAQTVEVLAHELQVIENGRNSNGVQ